jgi:hypothetical protein
MDVASYQTGFIAMSSGQRDHKEDLRPTGGRCKPKESHPARRCPRTLLRGSFQWCHIAVAALRVLLV